MTLYYSLKRGQKKEKKQQPKLVFPRILSQQVYCNTLSHIFSQTFIPYVTKRKTNHNNIKHYTTNMKQNTHSSSTIHSSNESESIRTPRTFPQSRACVFTDECRVERSRENILSVLWAFSWPMTYDLWPRALFALVNACPRSEQTPVEFLSPLSPRQWLYQWSEGH